MLSAAMCGTGCGSSSNDIGHVSPPITAVELSETGYGEATDGQLQQKLEAIRKAYTVPAIGAMIVKGDTILEMGVSGLRQADQSIAVTLNDRWHIGSLTKSMTATVAMKLVEQGVITLDSTIIDVFPTLTGQIKFQYETITLGQLLSHTGGLIRELPSFREQRWFINDSSLTEQRRQWTIEMLNTESNIEIGAHSYSNAGYVIAGHMLEAVTNMSWEDLMRQSLFEPLQMNNTSFGEPDIDGTLEQPRGHIFQNNRWENRLFSQGAVNPPVMAPAAYVGLDMTSMANYLIAQLSGARGGDNVIHASSYQTLHSPVDQGYAMGWYEMQRDFTTSKLLYHNGTNGFWTAQMWLIPDEDIALFAVSNAGGEAAADATNEALVALLTRYGLLAD